MFNLLHNIGRNLLRTPATRRYPVERRAPPAGTRGHLDMEIGKCTFCTLCAKRCPASAIVVTRKPNTWTLDPYRCILCNYCVEVCPTHCIHMQPEHRPPVS